MTDVMEIRSYDEFREVWAEMSDLQRERVRAKAQWEAISLLAVLNEWPSMRVERVKRP